MEERNIELEMAESFEKQVRGMERILNELRDEMEAIKDMDDETFSMTYDESREECIRNYQQEIAITERELSESMDDYWFWQTRADNRRICEAIASYEPDEMNIR